MRYIFVVVFLLVNISIVGATAIFTSQKSDTLIYNGKKLSLNSNPLEPYFNLNPTKRPKSEISSTALWRGYVATFEYIDDQLYIIDVQIMAESLEWDGVNLDTWGTTWKSVFKDIFPDKNKYKVDWYSGILIVPTGKLKNYVQMGYSSTYSKYLLFATSNGNLNEVRKYSLKEFMAFKKKQFEKYKLTEDYKKLFKELKESKYYANDKDLNSFIQSYITNYTTEFFIE